jgi:Protein of unknown function (DUF1648)
MDLSRWIFLLRWPLEIVSFGLALAPLLSVLVAWASLPAHIPVHFGSTGGTDCRGGRAQAWILPVMALVVYGFMSEASGTWAWALHGRTDLPAGAEILLILKPAIALLMVYANQMLILAARKQAEALNGWLLCGLMMLLIAPPFALSFAAL